MATLSPEDFKNGVKTIPKDHRSMLGLTASLQLDILVQDGRLIVTRRVPEVGLARS